MMRRKQRSPAATRPAPRRRSLWILLAAPWLCAGPPASASTALHPPPMLYFSLRLEGPELIVQAQIKRGLVPDWFPFDWEDVPAIDAGRRPEAREAIESFFAKHARVALDGRPATGTLRELRTISYLEHMAFHEYVTIDLTYALDQAPTEFSFQWNKYDDYPTWWAAPIDGELAAHGHNTFFTVKRDEPRFDWQAAAAAEELPTEIPPPALPPAIRLPLPSIVLSGLVLLMLPVLWRRGRRLGRRRPRTLAAIALAGAGGAILLSGTGKVSMPLPWNVPPAMPDAGEAERIFATLHRNIYRAFDAATESAIYDTLAHSVTGDLLDSVYREVYQNWFFRDRGGAVCHIDRTERLETEVDTSPVGGETTFRVDCRWRVHGFVRHWGHTHTRVNEYHAHYTVAATPAGWRIATVDLLDQHRVGLKDPRAWPQGSDVR